MNSEEKIWCFFLEKLNNAYGVAGLMGNLYVESSLQSCKLEVKYARKFGMTSEEYTIAVDNGTYDNFVHDSAGYGLAQWTYWSRKEAFLAFAKGHNVSIGDLDMQLEYLWEELQKYKTVINTLYTATSVREASDVVCLKYEKPQHTSEEFLANRAKYGQKFYDEYAGGEVMYTAKQVDEMLAGWLSQNLPKEEVVVKLANACLGWNYIFGDRGELCTPSHVRSRISSLAKDYPTQSENLKKKCQVANGKKSSCDGCQFYPNGETRAYDCRGFTYWCFLKGAGITIEGGGATSQYNNNNNWDEKGVIANMPKNKVCCVFRYDSSTKKYEHTLIYDGDGHYIHDSTYVKKCDVSKYKATHYAIPKGLYGGVIPVVIAQAKVVASSGSTVNLRASKSTSSTVLAQIPVGTIVDITEKGDDWCGVLYQGRQGYMMTKFLDFNVSPSVDTVVVSKADLETIYRMIGKMLEN